MARQMLVANWKDHPASLDEADLIIKGMAKHASTYKKLHTFIAPPLPYFDIVSKKAQNFANLASQDIFESYEGTYTGAVLPDILKSFGTKLAIIGHSEMRALGETDKSVAQKIRVAIKAGIVPLVCVGETARDEKGDYLEFLKNELRGSLAGLRRKDDASKIVIAYEPIWAIGKKAKDAANKEEVTEMVIFIRKVVASIFGRSAAEKMPILYGGSVEPENAAVLAKETGIRGFLVGHASLDPEGFNEIANALI